MAEKNRVVLLMPRTGPVLMTPPFALMALATPLEEAGYDVDIVDTRCVDHREALPKLLDRGDVLSVNLTCMTGPQILHGIKLSRWVKEKYPGVPVVWGGIHASYLPEQTIANPYIDYVCVGVGEPTILEMQACFKRGEAPEEVAGVVWKDKAGRIVKNKERPPESLEKIPPYAWHLVDPKPYIVPDLVRGRTISMFSSRGCPHLCTFCYIDSFHHRKWKGQSPEEVLAEVDYLRGVMEFDSVYFHDDNFAVNKKRVREIAKGFKERGIWFGFALKVNYLNDEFAKFLSEHNCDRLDWGAESGSNKILGLYQKGQTREHSIRAAHLMAKYGMSGQVSTVIGHPEETYEDMLETLDMMDEMQRINPRLRLADTKILTLYPGNHLYDEAVSKYGFQPPTKLEDWSEFYWNSAQTPWLFDRNMMEVISFTTLIVFVHWRLRKQSRVYNFLLEAFHRLEKLRWRKRFFKFAPEVRLMKYYLDLINYALR